MLNGKVIIIKIKQISYMYNNANGVLRNNINKSKNLKNMPRNNNLFSTKYKIISKSKSAISKSNV